MQLQNMCKREHESFKEYAQRWRDLETQVASPMMEREMITMIVDTLPVFYYEKMVGYMPSIFADLIFVGERIEVGLRRGKFNYVASTSAGNKRTRTGGAKKKEGDAHTVTTTPTWLNSQQTPHNPMYQYPPHQYNYSANIGSPPYPTPIQPRMPNQPQRPPQHHPQNPFPTQPRPSVNPNPNTNTNPRRNFPERKPAKFTLIPMLYADLLPSLLNNQMAMVSSGKVYPPPFSQLYNPNATCTYHGGVLGHSIEQCVALKHKVQSLIDAGWLTFQENSLNVRTNPLANHGGSSMNAVEEWESRGLKRIGDVSTSRRFILEALREAGIVDLDSDRGDPCLMHPGASHNMETCPIAEELLQGMISRGQIEICSAKKEEEEVCMQSCDKNPSMPKPLVIHFTRNITT